MSGPTAKSRPVVSSILTTVLPQQRLCALTHRHNILFTGIHQGELSMVLIIDGQTPVRFISFYRALHPLKIKRLGSCPTDSTNHKGLNLLTSPHGVGLRVRNATLGKCHMRWLLRV